MAQSTTRGWHRRIPRPCALRAQPRQQISGFDGGDTRCTNEDLLTCPCDWLFPLRAGKRHHRPERSRQDAGPRDPRNGQRAHLHRQPRRTLHERDVLVVVPDILANAGGVTVSYFEQVQNTYNYYWSLEEVHRELSATHEPRPFRAVHAEYEARARPHAPGCLHARGRTRSRSLPTTRLGITHANAPKANRAATVRERKIRAATVRERKIRAATVRERKIRAATVRERKIRAATVRERTFMEIAPNSWEVSIPGDCPAVRTSSFHQEHAKKSEPRPQGSG
jgi:hypothetical protein